MVISSISCCSCPKQFLAPETLLFDREYNRSRDDYCSPDRTPSVPPHFHCSFSQQLCVGARKILQGNAVQQSGLLRGEWVPLAEELG